MLLFPHAILHESALSFLGLGLSPHEPAIGILLADGMRYLSVGAWWLAVLPGLALLLMVKTVDVLGQQLRSLTDPADGAGVTAGARSVQRTCGWCSPSTRPACGAGGWR